MVCPVSAALFYLRPRLVSPRGDCGFVALGDGLDATRRLRATPGFLESLGGAYRPFAGILRRLAGGYQSKAILALVNDCLKRTQAP